MTHEDQFSARHRTLDTLQEGIVITGGLRSGQLVDLGYPHKPLWVNGHAVAHILPHELTHVV